MRGRYALIVIGAAAFCLPAPAIAATPEPALEEVEVYVQDIDKNGKPKGPRIRLSAEEAAKLRSTGLDRKAERDAAPASVRMPASVRRIASSGCRSVSVARVGRSLFGFVTYKFWQQKDWCWTYPRVTGALSYVYLTDVDANWRWRGITSSWGDFYSWCCSTWNSGHQSFRQGFMENCVLAYGCIRAEYPWVLVRGHSDGSFSYDTGY